MNQSVVLVDEPAAGVVRLLINRPDKRNAIDHAVRTALYDSLSQALAQESTRALVLGGSGGMFSAGGDLPSMAGLDAGDASARMRHVARLCRLVASIHIPVLTAIEGVAAGAAIGLALLGDEIIVGTGTRILFPFLKLGLVPDWGQALTLPRRVGLGAARRIFMDGETVDGSAALAMGLADHCQADSEVMDFTVARAAALARLPQHALARTKARLNHPSASLDEELYREERDQVACLIGPEFAEGYDAFTTKRRADFTRLGVHAAVPAKPPGATPAEPAGNEGQP